MRRPALPARGQEGAAGTVAVDRLESVQEVFVVVGGVFAQIFPVGAEDTPGTVVYTASNSDIVDRRDETSGLVDGLAAGVIAVDTAVGNVGVGTGIHFVVVIDSDAGTEAIVHRVGGRDRRPVVRRSSRLDHRSRRGKDDKEHCQKQDGVFEDSHFRPPKFLLKKG